MCYTVAKAGRFFALRVILTKGCEKMEKMITREEALALLRRYNKEPFHLQHALTVEAVMRWFANELGYGEEADFWAMCGLLHDIDFENWPQEHCKKAPELLRPAGVGEAMIHAICSHGHKICTKSPRSTRWKRCCLPATS